LAFLFGLGGGLVASTGHQGLFELGEGSFMFKRGKKLRSDSSPGIERKEKVTESVV